MMRMQTRPSFFEDDDRAMRELMQLRGIGEQIARALVRKGIRSRDDFQRADRDFILLVPGIGVAKYESIMEQLRQ